MKLDLSLVDVASGPVSFEEDKTFYIPQELTSKVYMLLSKNIYSSNTRFVSELYANALDAGDPDPSIFTPSKLTPVFEIEDHGSGMTREFMTKKYIQPLYSSKENTDDKIGAFGIGRLSALAVTDSYTILTIPDDGSEPTHALVAKNSTGIPFLRLLPLPNSLPFKHGTRISVPLTKVQDYEFEKICAEVYKLRILHNREYIEREISHDGVKVVKLLDHTPYLDKIFSKSLFIKYLGFYYRYSYFCGEQNFPKTYTFMEIELPPGTCSVSAPREGIIVLDLQLLKSKLENFSKYFSSLSKNEKYFWGHIPSYSIYNYYWSNRTRKWYSRYSFDLTPETVIVIRPICCRKRAKLRTMYQDKTLVLVDEEYISSLQKFNIPFEDPFNIASLSENPGTSKKSSKPKTYKYTICDTDFHYTNRPPKEGDFFITEKRKFDSYFISLLNNKKIYYFSSDSVPTKLGLKDLYDTIRKSKPSGGKIISLICKDNYKYAHLKAAYLATARPEESVVNPELPIFKLLNFYGPFFDRFSKELENLGKEVTEQIPFIQDISSNIFYNNYFYTNYNLRSWFEKHCNLDYTKIDTILKEYDDMDIFDLVEIFRDEEK